MPPRVPAQHWDSVEVSPETTLPMAPRVRTRSQQLNKVSFICDVQIQPMQKEITFPFDSSDNKLLKKKNIYQGVYLQFPLKKPERVKKNHTHVIYTFDINKNNLKESGYN